MNRLYRNTYFNIVLGVGIAIIILLSTFMLYNNPYFKKEAEFTSPETMKGTYLNEGKKSLNTESMTLFPNSNLSISLIYITISSSSNYSNIILAPKNLTITYSDGSQFYYSKNVFLNDTFRISPKSNTLIAALIVYPGLINKIHINLQHLYYYDDKGYAVPLKTLSINWETKLYIQPGQTTAVYITINLEK